MTRQNSKRKREEEARIKKCKRTRRNHIEQLKNTDSHRICRKNPNYRAKEQERNTLSHREDRENPNYRAKEQERNTLSHREDRQNPEYRAKEQEQDTLSHREDRQNPEYRAKEQARDTAAHKANRQNPTMRQKEQCKNSAEHQRARQVIKSDWNMLLKEFGKTVEMAADQVCCVCAGLFFPASIQKLSTEFEKTHSEILAQVLRANCNSPHIFCSTCFDSVNRGRVPTMCEGNGLTFPEVPYILKDLTDLEERLVSARIPFMQIRSLGAGGQYGLRGNVVNVVNDIDLCTSSIPRTLDQSKTVQVMFMRQMKGKVPTHTHSTVCKHKFKLLCQET